MRDQTSIRTRRTGPPWGDWRDLALDARRTLLYVWAEHSTVEAIQQNVAHRRAMKLYDADLAAHHGTEAML